MSSNKSRPVKTRIALQPQRSHGKLRVAALLEAGASVIATRGFQAATMAEIALKAGAPIGSLYRFFPNKEILADALIQRFGDLISARFEKINHRIHSLSNADLAGEFLSLIVDLQGESLAIRALLEAHADWSAKRIEFRRSMRQRLARTLLLRSPRLNPKVARNMAVVILQNMKSVGLLSTELQGESLSGALQELREMTRLYLSAKLES
jgi:AcrR family transcriptional regulator